MQDFKIAFLSNFFTFRFFLIQIQKLSFFIRIFNDIVIFVLKRCTGHANWLILSNGYYGAMIATNLKNCILFLMYRSLWVLTSVFWTLCKLSFLIRHFKSSPIKCLWIYLCFLVHLFLNFLLPSSLKSLSIFHILFSSNFFLSSVQYQIIFQGRYL